MALLKAFIILTCVALYGCNKTDDVEERVTSTTSPAPPSPVKDSPHDSRPVIVALGDSLSEGLGVDPALNFPSRLQTRLDGAGFKYKVVNMGISGDTTSGGLARLDYVLAAKPAVVILELGGNDGLRGVPATATKANLEAIIVKLKSSGAEVLLAGMTLPPNYGAEYVSKFEGIYTDLAKKHKLKLIPFLMEDIRSQIATKKGLMQGDGIHPTAAGHALIAETVFRSLQPMLHR
jgi:acyl-CoA thioesterase-1